LIDKEVATMATSMDSKVPFPVETFELVLYSSNPDAPHYADDERRRIVLEHLAWARAQLEAGNAVLAGAIGGDVAMNGMGLFCTGSLERVRQIMAGDPAIAAGIDTYQLATFTTRAGAIKRPGGVSAGDGHEVKRDLKSRRTPRR
jgi:hypothetical protein